MSETREPYDAEPLHTSMGDIPVRVDPNEPETPGWHLEPPDRIAAICARLEHHAGDGCTTELFAHAPADLTYLLAEVERLRAALDDTISNATLNYDVGQDAIAEVKRLRAALRYIEALDCGTRCFEAATAALTPPAEHERG